MSEENIFAGVPEAEKADVEKAVNLAIEAHGKANKAAEPWHCSALMGHSVADGTVTLEMAICSGMECSMLKDITVHLASGEVTFPKKKGFF